MQIIRYNYVHEVLYILHPFVLKSLEELIVIDYFSFITRLTDKVEEWKEFHFQMRHFLYLKSATNLTTPLFTYIGMFTDNHFYI